ncbi:DsrE family protein [Desulfurobacterium sp.]
MKLAVIIGTDKIRRIRSAISFANIAIEDGNEVKVFFLGECFDTRIIDAEEVKLKDRMEKFLKAGGQFYTCGTCIVIEKYVDNGACPLSTMEDLYEIVKWADKTVHF